MKRGRGRPPLSPGVASVELGVSLPEPDLRAVSQIAVAERVNPQEIIRRAVTKFLRDRQRHAARLARGVVVTRGRVGL